MAAEFTPTAARPADGTAPQGPCVTLPVGVFIDTDKGRIPVERLRPGDRMHLAGQGAMAAVHWLSIGPRGQGGRLVRVMLGTGDRRHAPAGIVQAGRVSPEDGRLYLNPTPPKQAGARRFH
ncbi:hypothetical protein CLV78_101899 [Aliiruegeria haliotis]|uniref:Hint domain-containing protein n=1 Tax=Aliiruegeria haliotis TaxID=1280846 RepID=A0A2T0S039_9RHOB|nr:hypothetical protein [Aliiruegeria haliotis]PRY26797.1 hypothetical protein CLV78_101899 [Aliiruegeria haliotis]